MIPDLGKYAFTVLASYGVTFVLIAVLIGTTMLRSYNVKRRLAEQEGKAPK